MNPTRRRIGGILLAAGVAVSVLSATRLADTSRRTAGPDFGAVAPQSPGRGTPTVPVSRAAAVATAVSSTVAARSTHVVIDRSGPPGSLRLPTLGVSAAVLPVTTDGPSLNVPDDPARLGWWVASAPAGSSTGTTVLDGHVDSAASGPGALYRVALGQLAVGDPISVTTTAGNRFDYHVVAARTFVKTGGLPAQLFTASGPARLILITCGGPFNRTTRSYEDNIVIYADPERAR